ncbi:hypothetical protein NXF25_016684 [Crotalus adamanteus]|uniref:Uncharacterized protein n=1 Tax=Crotalus adamanteus TaxID=8729 RepID=A0AAW1AS04_CROAD
MCLSMEAGKRKEASSQNKQSGALCAQLALDMPKSCAAAVGGSETAWGLLCSCCQVPNQKPPPPKAGEMPSHSVQESSPILVLISEPVKDAALASLGPAEGGFLTPPVKDLGPLSRRGRLALRHLSWVSGCSVRAGIWTAGPVQRNLKASKDRSRPLSALKANI